VRARLSFQQKAVALTALLLLQGCHSPEPDELLFTHMYDALGSAQGQANTEWLNDRINVFQRLYPQPLLKLQQVKWDNIDTKVMSDYRAGIRHDVVFTSYQLLAKHRLVGDLADLDPLMNWPAEKVAEFSWSPIWHGCVVNGKRLGLPLGSHARLCVYNKEMFRQAGLDPDKPPQTMDELVQCAQKLTRDLDGDGLIDVWGLGMYLGPSRANLELVFGPLLWHFNGTLWDEKSKRACFASAEGEQTAQFIKALLKTWRVTPPWAISGTYDDVVMRAFFNEKIAIAWGWGSYWIQALEQSGWVTGCHPPTVGAQMPKAGLFITPTHSQTSFTNTWTVSIHSRAKWPEAGMKLIEILMDPIALTKAPDSGLPLEKSMWERPEYQTPFYQTWFQAIEKGRGMPPTGHYEELSGSIVAAMQEILVRDRDIRTTLRKFQEAYNKRYAGE